MGNTSNKKFLQTYKYITREDLQKLETKHPSHFYLVLRGVKGTVKVLPSGKVEDCLGSLYEDHFEKRNAKIGLDRRNWDLLHQFLDAESPTLSDGVVIENPISVWFPALGASVLVVLNATWNEEKKQFTYRQTLEELQVYLCAKVQAQVRKLVIIQYSNPLDSIYTHSTDLTKMEQLQFRDILYATKISDPVNSCRYLSCAFDLPEHGRCTLVKVEDWKHCYFRCHSDNSIFKEAWKDEFLEYHVP